MRERNVNPKIIEAVFGMIQTQLKNEKDCQDLDEIFENAENRAALNLKHPDKDVNILHLTASMDEGSMILSHLNKYIKSDLYIEKNFQGMLPIAISAKVGGNNSKSIIQGQKDALMREGRKEPRVRQEIKKTLNKQDLEGNTPLHIAAHQHNSELIDLLILEGADASIRNKAGLTPIIVAAKEHDGNDRMIDTIASLGVSQTDLKKFSASDKKTLLQIIESTQNFNSPQWDQESKNTLLNRCKQNNQVCSIM